MFTSWYSESYAIEFSTNKQQYNQGDMLLIAGKIDEFVDNQYITLRILDPTNSELVKIDQFLPSKDKRFSNFYMVDGSKWQNDGKYSISVFYGTESFEVKVDYLKNTEKDKSESKSISTSDSEIKNPIEVPNFKTWIPGFPDPKNSPQYYFDRYEKEPEYKSWFEKAFSGITIAKVVAYPKTYVNGFPDNTKSPQYYIDRYNNEGVFREWFDTQFPDKTLYDVLDYPESLFLNVPQWIKNSAKWWASGLISDTDFLTGVQYLIQENIISLGTLPETLEKPIPTIPHWVKNTANLWADDVISEDEFTKSLQFLVENGIIVV